jgi:hypothetical protein
MIVELSNDLEQGLPLYAPFNWLDGWGAQKDFWQGRKE